MPTNFEPLTIHEAAAAMRAGGLTPNDLLEQCLARIDRYESLVRAWVVVDRDGARQQAERLTDELKRGEVRGPLHGIPVGVKDIIDVFDLPTGCGSQLWANSIARQDATCVSRLRAAGAVILGKTVTTAYAYLDPPVTRNPWDPTRTPGGSSSGSAAAVACGMCLGALGTQTVGSLTRPASYCGVCSYKPNIGAIPTDSVLPLAPTLDHVGVMARCVTDLANLADALMDDFAAFAAIERNALESKSPQFVVPDGHFADRVEPEMVGALGGVRDLDRLGPVEGREWPMPAADIPRHLRAILATEAAAFHGDRLRRHPDDYPPRIRDLIDEGLRVPLAAYRAALEHRTTTQDLIEDAFFRGGACLMTPATPGPAPDRSTTGDGVLNAPWSYTGHSTVSVPTGRSDGELPIAVQLVGSRGSAVSDLFAPAAWLERRLSYDTKLPPAPETFTIREP